MWIPAGTLLQRPRIPGKDDLFSNFYQTREPTVSEDLIAGENLVNEAKNLGLVENVRFSKVVLSEGSQTRILTVVGTPSEVHNKVRKKQILRG